MIVGKNEYRVYESNHFKELIASVWPELHEYGFVTMIAVFLIKFNNMDPMEAWSIASKYVKDHIYPGLHLDNHFCPRNSFLTLCEKGYLNCIQFPYLSPVGANKNWNHAKNALKVIDFENENWTNMKGIWSKVTKVKHNGQIDVIYALYKSGVLNMEKVSELKLSSQLD